MKTNLIYFAYGSNMSTAQMNERCPDAVKIGVATLPGYEFIINGRGVAGIVEKHDASVLGICWKISSEDKDTLDRCEGANLVKGAYFLQTMAITTAGESVDALVYLARNTVPGRAKKGYLEKIVKAAVHHGIDPSYVRCLEASCPVYKLQSSRLVEDYPVSSYELFDRFASTIRELAVEELSDAAPALIQKMKLASYENH
jgi:gamma-glutamylcyclotransferase (GGCT)/AIG2-like uncharacterized protein YtfP